MNLTACPQQYVIVKGRVYTLSLAFDKVLRVFELWKEDLLTNTNKLNLSLDILVKRGKWKNLTIAQKGELLTAIFDQCVKGKVKRGGANNEKTFDFVQDAEYIFASFFMDYGVDLIAEQGRLSWDKFMALFAGLSERTKIREVMSIRARKIPVQTKYNAEEIKNLRELKQLYALEISEEERTRQFERGLDQLFGTLSNQAKAVK